MLVFLKKLLQLSLAHLNRKQRLAPQKERTLFLPLLLLQKVFLERHIVPDPYPRAP